MPLRKKSFSWALTIFPEGTQILKSYNVKKGSIDWDGKNLRVSYLETETNIKALSTRIKYYDE